MIFEFCQCRKMNKDCIQMGHRLHLETKTRASGTVRDDSCDTSLFGYAWYKLVRVTLKSVHLTKIKVMKLYRIMWESAPTLI